MGRSGNKSVSPEQDLRNNRRQIQRYEAQITRNNRLLVQYGEQYDVLRSAIGNLDTVMSNIQGIQHYAEHVFYSNTKTASQWSGEEYRYTDDAVTITDHDFDGYYHALEVMKQQLCEKEKKLQDEMQDLKSSIRSMNQGIAYLQMKQRALRLLEGN